MSGTKTNNGTDLEVEALLREVGAREQPSPEMTSAVREAVHAEWTHVVGERRRARRRVAALAIAASVAVVGSGTLALLLPHLRTEPAVIAHVERFVGPGALLVGDDRLGGLQANTSIRAGQSLRTADNARVALHISPGLELRIDGNSEVKFAAANRIVLSRGAVYVDASAPAQALVIETSFGKVQHVGTQYETRVGDGLLRVRVRSGAVTLVSDAGSTTAQAGEQLNVSMSRVSREPIAVAGPDWQWLAQLAGNFELENRSLADFLKWAGHETGYEIVYDSDRARDAAHQVILHGSVAGLTPDSALTAVLSTTRFTYRQTANRITVSLRP